MHLDNAVIKLPRTLMLCITVLVINACDGNTFEIDESLSSEGGGTEATINSEQTINPTVPPEPEPEPEPEPVATFSSIAYPIKSNESRQHDNAGPQSVSKGNETNFPGLRYGDFLLKNNAWNLYNTQYTNWYQTITLEESNNAIVAKVDWDYGVQSDLNFIYNVTSYPEIIYGTKSQYESSGDAEDIGLPVAVNQSPVWTVDYSFNYVERLSANNSFSTTSDSEFNVAIESFWHSSCDIRRDSDPRRENRVFELMVWLKVKQRKPSGQPPIKQLTTTDGRTFDVYTKPENPQYIAYVATEELTTGSINYSEFIQDAIDNASAYNIYQLKPSDCMANILMGPEIWHGAGTFYWNRLQINRAYY
jgi:hypothetical protein